jgi:AcrR family transcriptional regulator
VSPDVKGQPSEAVPPELPRGRHNLPTHVVRASQRQRLLAAMLDSVADNGYDATTVPAVVARARVSRNAFYALFRDKVDCFIALCDDLAEQILAEMNAMAGASDWVEALRTGTARYLAWWADRPAFSRTYFVELPTAGARAVEQRDRQYARFRELFDGLAAWARVQQPGLPPLRPLATRTIVLAVTEIVAEEVRGGRTAQLTDLTDEIVFLIATLIAGDGTASRVVGASG